MFPAQSETVPVTLRRTTSKDDLAEERACTQHSVNKLAFTALCLVF